MFYADLSNPDKATLFYQEWIQDVEKTVPSDRLLTFDVRQGWKPLCHFLNHANFISDEPFPKLNETKDFLKLVVNNKWSTWRKLVLGGSFWMLLISFLTYCLVQQ